MERHMLTVRNTVLGGASLIAAAAMNAASFLNIRRPASAVERAAISRETKRDKARRENYIGYVKNRARRERLRDPDADRAQAAINKLTNRERNRFSRALMKFPLAGNERRRKALDVAFIETFDCDVTLNRLCAARGIA